MSFNVSPYTSSNAMWPSSFGGGVSKYEERENMLKMLKKGVQQLEEELKRGKK